MVVEQGLISRFERERPRLRAVAYRMLGSSAEADDIVQEAWLRLDRTEAAEIGNLAAWLTTVVSRLCLNLLRSREARREAPLDELPPDSPVLDQDARGPADEAELAEEVGLALLVVLDALSPAERVAFVLHDLFEVAFDDMAPMMERSTVAVRQLASRARRRVRGAPAPEAGAGDAGERARRRRAVEAYLAATRVGDFEALLRLLDPDVVLCADTAVLPSPSPLTLRGALTVARSAVAAVDRAAFTELALVDGAPGLVMAPLGRLVVAMRFGFSPAGILEIDVIAEPERLRRLEISVVEG